MKQKKIGEQLYVFPTNEPYVITKDIEAKTIYVQLEQCEDFKKLNPTLKLTPYNYKLLRTNRLEWDEFINAEEIDERLTLSDDMFGFELMNPFDNSIIHTNNCTLYYNLDTSSYYRLSETLDLNNTGLCVFINKENYDFKIENLNPDVLEIENVEEIDGIYILEIMVKKVGNATYNIIFEGNEIYQPKTITSTIINNKLPQ